MGRKGKKQKHTAAALAAKERANRDRAGGKGGIARRKPKNKFLCPICRNTLDSIKLATQHYDSKHPKVTFNEADLKQA